MKECFLHWCIYNSSQNMANQFCGNLEGGRNFMKGKIVAYS